LREYRWWVERYGIADQRAPIVDVDPQNIASAGWGVLFAPDVPAEAREALRPLLHHRREEAGPFYKEFIYRPGSTKQDFLAEHRAGPGPADPRRVPYYLLIVGGPETIPFSFQYSLDVQYAVGRISFERPEEYDHYARSVVTAEVNPSPRPRQLVFFNPESSADPTSRQLVNPLAEALSETGWEICLFLGDQATKANLGTLLGDRAPALLFATGQGVRLDLNQPRQLLDQGALVCQGWSGPGATSAREHYFSAEDVPEDAHVEGLIAFLFSGDSGGSPDLDEFSDPSSGEPNRIAPRPFLARLPQRLLSHPCGGALAVISHVDKAWTLSSGKIDRSQLESFEDVLRALLGGQPVGMAMEYINQRYAELAVELAHLWDDRNSSLEGSRARFEQVWRAAYDARNLVVLGDPAVRLTYRAS
jgi:hypothetical protein